MRSVRVMPVARRPSTPRQPRSQAQSATSGTSASHTEGSPWSHTANGAGKTRRRTHARACASRKRSATREPWWRRSSASPGSPRPRETQHGQRDLPPQPSSTTRVLHRKGCTLDDEVRASIETAKAASDPGIWQEAWAAGERDESRRGRGLRPARRDVTPHLDSGPADLDLVWREWGCSRRAGPTPRNRRRGVGVPSHLSLTRAREGTRAFSRRRVRQRDPRPASSSRRLPYPPGRRVRTA